MRLPAHADDKAPAGYRPLAAGLTSKYLVMNFSISGPVTDPRFDSSLPFIA